ncbi:hypothetical protein SpCBS45565_g01300 [Spizellomyces sp. 'palustris']|nr:hypothetical protein SpCBS45565_g01300 [Spizellomyces sp. 'palustris']
MSAVTRSDILSTYRGILREVSKQYTHRNKNRVWHNEVVARFRAGATLSDPVTIEESVKDARNILTFMRSNREHRNLVERYWPATGLSNEEKLTRTANTVGLSLPKMFGAEEIQEGPVAAGLDEAFKIVQNARS